jgi:hypothetical protein
MTRPSENTTPVIEAYTDKTGVVVELYIEVAAFRDSFDTLFGKGFTDALLTMDSQGWGTSIGAEAIVRHAKSGNTETFFADAPSKGICACICDGGSQGVHSVVVHSAAEASSN